eukprot:CAMPEP_0114689856 /NCGR_PEP_ID=MMETSP0191-20121206/65026_1 /TAXON_ID=126664 /ORGANISM="Sorites sp." /LENGTH=68 /DNA_ID=CAMNT_0001979017 /DNA_START=24 /DNA_END=231 /DNA_ORIENTATION=+
MDLKAVQAAIAWRAIVLPSALPRNPASLAAQLLVLEPSAAMTAVTLIVAVASAKARNQTQEVAQLGAI